MSHVTQTVFPSAQRTATSNVSLGNPGRRGMILTIDVTDDPAVASVTFTIRGRHPGTSSFYNILTSAAVNAVGTTSLTVYPGLSDSPNVQANSVLPAEVNVLATHGNADAITYSVIATFI